MIPAPNRVVNDPDGEQRRDHVLGALLFETEWETARAVEAAKDTERLGGLYNRKLQKLIRDSAFRKKLTERFTADHTAFE